MSSLIELYGLEKVYRGGPEEVTALAPLDLKVEEGDFVALMGPSGSGKTTLLNIIAGVDHPSAGRAVINGADISSMSENQKSAWRTRNIGYIFQFYNLLPVLTAYENVELPLLLLPLSPAQRHDHVLAALEAVDILDRKGHTPKQMSGGQQQRVAIARAIVTDAHILVADEPTGNLDAHTEKEIMTLLQRLNSEMGKTILMVTHDQAAANFAKSKLRLEKGVLVHDNREAPCS